MTVFPPIPTDLDARLTPAWPDVADPALEGRVQATAFASPEPFQVSAGVAPVRKAPEDDAEMLTQARFGEAVAVYAEVDGWARARLATDGYCGYVAMEALSAPVDPPSMRVTALRTYVFSEPSVKSAPRFLISRGAPVPLTGVDENGFVEAPRAGWVWPAHLGELNDHAPDWVAVAETFLGAPYLWGGKESLGCDCSGLIQVALEAAGHRAPRDSDMQERALGQHRPTDDLSGLRRGDLIFWKGHVGVMLDAERVLHANAHHMGVAVEPITQAVDRIAKAAGPVTSIKRLDD